MIRTQICVQRAVPGAFHRQIVSTTIVAEETKQTGDRIRTNQPVHRLASVATLTALSVALVSGIHPPPVHAESSEETNPYIQELLRRTEANREQRKRENLDHYTTKVFSDGYFDFVGPVSPELQAQIDDWKAQHETKPNRRFAPQ